MQSGCAINTIHSKHDFSVFIVKNVEIHTLNGKIAHIGR